MGIQSCTGGLMTCTFGTAPASLNVLPTNMTMAGGCAAGNISDNTAFVTVPCFAMCNSMSNPTVSSATSAACGVLTPMPCTPMTSSPWIIGSPTAMIANKPLLNNSSTLMCSYGGVISFSFPGQVTVMG